MTRQGSCSLPSDNALYAKQGIVMHTEFKRHFMLLIALAQFNLAVMYLRGEGVAASNTNAHAWASLAAWRPCSNGLRFMLPISHFAAIC